MFTLTRTLADKSGLLGAGALGAVLSLEFRLLFEFDRGLSGRPSDFMALSLVSTAIVGGAPGTGGGTNSVGLT